MLAIFFFLEFGAAGGLKDCASAVDDLRNGLGLHGDKLLFKNASVALLDTYNFNFIENGSTDNGPDGCIHSGRISAGGKNAYSFYFVHSLMVFSVCKDSDFKIDFYY